MARLAHPSLRWTIVLEAWCVLALVLGGLLIFEYHSLERFLIQTTSERLRGQIKPIVDRQLLGPAAATADLVRLAPQLVRDATSRETGALIVDSQGAVIGEYRSTIGEPTAPELPLSDYQATLGGKLDVDYVLPNADGARQLVALVPLPPRSTPRAVLILSTSLTPADALLQRYLLWSITGSACALAVACVLLIVLVQTSFTPLLRMLAHVRHLAAGHFGQQLEARSSNDEVGQLIHAFNDMSVALQQAFAAQQRSEERLRQFVLDASHELRTPLAVLSGYLDVLLVAERNGAPITPAVRAMRREVNRTTRLVQDLLTLARTNVAATLVLQSVDVADLLYEVAEETRLMSDQYTVAVQIDQALEVPGDPDRLKQAFLNVSGNAVQHTPPGTAITVRAWLEAAHVVVQVADTGPGMPPPLLAHAFERFVRREGDNARHGMGIGLAIVKAIVEAHGGSVAMASDAHHGTTVTLYLPREHGA